MTRRIVSVFQFPRIGARMTQRQRVNYAWWQTSRNRVVASPGKTAAVGKAAKQGKITPGAELEFVSAVSAGGSVKFLPVV